MNRPFVLLLALAFSLSAARGSEEGADRKPGMVSRVWSSLFRRTPDRSEPVRGVKWKQLVMNMTIEPLPVKVSETRQIKVALQLTNRSRKLVQLDFPTTQRIEVLLRNQAGKLVEQWSEDQSFDNEPTLVAINPNERLEYAVSVSTRDMAAGQSYTIEGFFPNYERLKATRTVVAEK